MSDNPFYNLKRLATDDHDIAAILDKKTQADLLSARKINLERFEMGLYKIKALLKDPNYESFETLKKHIEETVTKEQQSFYLDTNNMR